MTVSIVFESLFCRAYCQAHSPTTTDEANLLPALPVCQRAVRIRDRYLKELGLGTRQGLD